MKVKNHRLEIDEVIFNNLSGFYAKSYNLPPLASKIYAYLIFDFDRKGLTFEDFVEIFSASKSSVSTSLTLLHQGNFIRDLQKAEERRRYFIINENFVKIRFQEVLDRLTEESKIVSALEDFRKEKNIEVSGRVKIYKKMLNNSIENIQNSLKQL